MGGAALIVDATKRCVDTYMYGRQVVLCPSVIISNESILLPFALELSGRRMDTASILILRSLNFEVFMYVIEALNSEDSCFHGAGGCASKSYIGRHIIRSILQVHQNQSAV